MYHQNAVAGAIFYQKTTVQCILESILNYALCTHAGQKISTSAAGHRHPFTTKYKIKKAHVLYLSTVSKVIKYNHRDQCNL